MPEVIEVWFVIEEEGLVYEVEDLATVLFVRLLANRPLPLVILLFPLLLPLSLEDSSTAFKRFGSNPLCYRCRLLFVSSSSSASLLKSEAPRQEPPELFMASKSTKAA